MGDGTTEAGINRDRIDRGVTTRYCLQIKIFLVCLSVSNIGKEQSVGKKGRALRANMHGG